MVLRSTPTSFIHSKSVEADSASGRPEEKPSRRMMRTRGSRKTAAAFAILSPKLGFCIPSAAVMVLLHSRMETFALPQKHAPPSELRSIMIESHAGAFHVQTISRRSMILGGTSAATLALGFPLRSAARELITLDEFLALSSRLTGAPNLDVTAASKLLDGFMS